MCTEVSPCVREIKGPLKSRLTTKPPRRAGQTCFPVTKGRPELAVSQQRPLAATQRQIRINSSRSNVNCRVHRTGYPTGTERQPAAHHRLLGPFHPEGLPAHHPTSWVFSSTRQLTHTSRRETGCKLRQGCCCQRHPLFSNRKLTIDGGGRMTQDRLHPRAPCSLCPQGRPDVLGHHSMKPCFFGIEEKRETSLPVHPGCHFWWPWPGFISKLSDLNRKLSPQFGSSFQKGLTVQSAD